MKTAWKDVVELLVAVYILISPFVLGFFDIISASISAIGIGTAAVLVSQLGIAKQQPWEEWTNLILGILLAASPWLFGYYDITIALVNAIISGTILAGFSLAAMVDEYQAIHYSSHPSGHGQVYRNLRPTRDTSPLTGRGFLSINTIAHSTTWTVCILWDY